MEEFLLIAQKLSGAGLATLLILILAGGYKKWWVWGWQLADCEARCAKDIAAAEQRTREWKEIAMPSVHVAEAAVTMARQKGVR